MPHHHTGKRSHGWMGLSRGHKARPLEWMVEKGIFLVALSTILMVFLIFLFVGKEALPIFFSKMNSASSSSHVIIPPGDIDKHSATELQAYLDLTPEEYGKKDKETLQL